MSKKITDYTELLALAGTEFFLIEQADGSYRKVDGNLILGAGTGDMSAATYDPTTIEGDAFDMDNMVEGTNLILTAAERAAIASGAVAHASAYISTAITNTANGTPAKVAGAGVTTTNLLAGFTHTTPNKLTYTDAATRVFKFTCALTCTHSASNVIMTFSIAKNGSNDATTSIQRKVGTGGDIGAFALEWLVSLAQNDYLELYCDANKAGTSTVSLGHISIVTTH